MALKAFMILSLVTVCTLALPTTHHDDQGRVEQLARANNDFTVRLHKTLSGDGKNVFFSPLSITAALSMLYAGTRGTTAEETRRVLGYDRSNLDENDVHAAFRQVLDELPEDGKNYLLDVANRVLSSSRVTVRDEYVNLLRTYYDARVDEVDFARDGARVQADVNQWVREKTRGKISSLLDQKPDPSTAMLLLNAVYFKGTWQTQFEKESTIPRYFRNAGNVQKRVPIMHMETKVNYTYSQELDSKLIELPYVGEDLSMVIVLPREYQGLEDLEEKLTSENLQHAVNELRPTHSVDILLPRFKLEEKYGLADALQKIGLREVFGNNADLSGISESPLKVSDVIHKAVVEVNEEGSEAAAVTGIVVVPVSAIIPPTKPSFHADHPFLFYIRQRSTGLILFFGRINEL